MSTGTVTGRFHRHDGKDIYVIFDCDGTDVRFIFHEKDAEKLSESGVDTIRIKEGARPRGVVKVGPPYHPKVVMPKSLLDEFGPAVLASATKLLRP